MTPTLTKTQVARLAGRLESGKPVDVQFPGVGRLTVERPLPFLAVYALNNDVRDFTVKRLIRGEASIFFFDKTAENREFVVQLLSLVIEILSAKFGAFLVVELSMGNGVPEDDSILRPAFRLGHGRRYPIEMVADAFHRELKRYRFNRQTPLIERTWVLPALERGANPWLDRSFLAKHQASVLSVSVNPFMINPETNSPYPLTLRSFHRLFSRALRRAIFEFTEHFCNRGPAVYQALGKRGFVKNIRDIDNRISEIDASFNILFLVTPYNVEPAWRSFKAAGYKTEPVFRYRPIPVEPSDLKYQLHKLDLSVIEDPVLHQIFHQKRIELDRQISLLQDRNTLRFLYGSLQLFGAVPAPMLVKARAILEAIPPRRADFPEDPTLGAKKIRIAAEREIGIYREQYPEFDAQVFVESEISGILVSRGNLYVGKGTRVAAPRLQSLLHHEIGTHIVTYHNGKAQPFRLLQSGFAGYEELQEGIAIFAEMVSGGLTTGRMRLLAARVVAVDAMTRGADFVECNELLHRELGFNRRQAFLVAMRTYRGGGFAKDAVYLKGFFRLLSYLPTQKDWNHLFYGKVSFEQLSLVKELEARRILKQIPVIPAFMGLYEEGAFPFVDDRLDDDRILALLLTHIRERSPQ